MEKAFRTFLRDNSACEPAYAYAAKLNFDPVRIWAECDRPDWLVWLAAKMEGCSGWPSKAEIVAFAADCAEKVLHIYEIEYPDDDRPHKAIESVRAGVDADTARIAAKESVTAAVTAADYVATAARAAAYAAAACYTSTCISACYAAQNAYTADPSQKQWQLEEIRNRWNPDHSQY